MYRAIQIRENCTERLAPTQPSRRNRAGASKLQMQMEAASGAAGHMRPTQRTGSKHERCLSLLHAPQGTQRSQAEMGSAARQRTTSISASAGRPAGVHATLSSTACAACTTVS